MIYSYKLHTIVLIIDNRSYRTKVKQNFSSQEELIQEISQGPIHDELFKNVCSKDSFYLTESVDVFNFANDTNFFLATKI